MRGTKQVRQLLLNEAAVDVLRSRPDLLRSPVLRRSMEAARKNTSGDYYVAYLDEWDRLLAADDVEKVAACVLAADEHGRALRVTSPLAFLLTDAQRADVARRAAQTPAEV